MKTCNGCQEMKPSEEFSISKAAKDGLQAKCKLCSAEYRRQWAKNNPEKARENSRRQTARLSERNPDYYNQWRRRNYLTPDGRAKQIARVQARRARLLEAEGQYTAEEFAELCHLYGNICLSCKEDKFLTVDHVIPLSLGGSNRIGNIQPLCKSCNSKKNTKTTDFRLDFALE